MRYNTIEARQRAIKQGLAKPDILDFSIGEDEHPEDCDCDECKAKRAKKAKECTDPTS